MFDDRPLARSETLLRFASPGAPPVESNLVAHPQEWFRVGPAHADETWGVGGLELVLAGPELLQGLGSFGGAPAHLEVAVLQSDGFGHVHDQNSVTLHVTETRRAWSRGDHKGTVVDPAGARYEGGVERVGLRGDPAQAAAFGDVASWLGPVIPARYGPALRGVAWELEPVRDPEGKPLDLLELTLHAGVEDTSGTITWTAHSIVPPAGQTDGSLHFPAPVQADHFRWEVALRFAESGESAYASEAVQRTPVLFTLGVWVELHASPWRFDNLAELIHKSDLGRELAAGGWDGEQDLITLRLPLQTSLSGERGEEVRARLVTAGDPLRLLEVNVQAEALHEEIREDV